MSIALCRACLTENARMQSIRNTQLHEVYEKLSNDKLITEDGRTETVCFTCYLQLQRCHNFSVMSQKANNILTQLYCDGKQITQEGVATLQEPFNLFRSLKNSPPNSQPQENQPVMEFKKECDSVKTEFVQIEESFSDNIKIEDTHGNDSTCSEASITEPGKKKKSFHLHKNNLSTPHSDLLIRSPRKQAKEQKNATLSRKPYYDESGTLVKHIKSYSKKQSNNVGTECNASFTQKNSLQKHIISHTGKTSSHSCEMCFKTFANKTNLKAHIKIHIGDKSSVCDRCGKPFINAYQLKRHMRSHTGEKPYKCDHCSRTFSDKGNLTKHLANHSEDNRSFVCTECNASFSLKCNLQRHMRSHTGETPFLCDICQKSLPDASLLRRHMRIHTGEKPFVCNACGKAYSDKDNYKCHMRRHTGEKPYACKLCDYKCAHATSLKYHLARKHSGNH